MFKNKSAEGHFFKASLAHKAKLVTYLVGYGVGFVLPLLLSLVFFFKLKIEWPLLFPLITGVTFGVTYLYRPLGYRLTTSELEILRPRGSRKVMLSDIKSISDNPDILNQLAVGLWRSVGFYGTFGLFWTKKYGQVYVYLTNNANIVEIVRWDGRRIYLSPDDKAKFIALLTEYLGAAGINSAEPSL